MGNFRNVGGRGNYRRSFSKSGEKRASFVLRDAQEEGVEKKTWKDARAQEEVEDKLLGFTPLPPGSRPRVGWLVNMVPGTVQEPLTKRPVQAVDLFFIADDGAGDFRATVISRPYMYLGAQTELLREVEIALRKKFADVVAEITTVHLEDISMPNHLAQDEGRPFLKVETRTVGDLFSMRQSLLPIIKRNSERKKHSTTLDLDTDGALKAPMDPLDAIEDMREYDVAPVNRLAIDRKINVGYWYRVSPGGDISAKSQLDADEDALDEQLGVPPQRDPDISASSANDFASAHLEKLPDIVERASPVVLAYDIECTKKPLKFPDPAAGDEVMMISWMVDGKGYLGINRKVVSKDIDDFEYKPHAEFCGSFEVYNEPDEKSLLERFFAEVRIAAPRVFVTFNGDYFDWPFVETRAAILGLDMGKEIGMRTNNDERIMSKETKGRAAIHMDVFHWVNRDSYLPQGSRGLKAVTRALLGFEPEEIPPEEMVKAALERPDEMAKYSVSDAVCTYHLYMKYVHPFIFSLCNIIPLNPDDVLRKGSGTLCEMLLMCQAREKGIVAPNKYLGSAVGKLTEDGHVLESETYIGGHVEAIRTGVFRSDLPVDFSIDIDALDDLENTLDDTLQFAITVEGKMSMDDVTNYNDVRTEIVKQLEALRQKPARCEKPLIYHLDVSAMYPNIILTNRLQPHAIVTPAQCAACDFNGMSECQRDMEWTWRGEFYPASRGEAEMILRLTAQEERETELRHAQEKAEADRASGAPERDFGSGRSTFKRPRAPGNAGNGAVSTKNPGIVSFDDEEARKNVLFRKRLKDYCRTNYRRTQDTRVVDKTATVCQRENPFYVDTVRAFRNRRYEYKSLLKKQKKMRGEVKASGDDAAIKSNENLIVLYDSLQLAHKCILNSFYGYVMRKGARWYSMEMAGIVTNTGGLIIRRAREFIDKVGLPLELDTDGIWCALPTSFPENFTFKTKSGKDYSISYICSVFNCDVAANFTNHQYQDLVDPDTFEYEQRSECSIMFEVDGPYKAMVLPASLEEGKSIKKRYAVFNDDGSLAELKGFEIKRRGELKLIKEFQGEIFERFLQGTTIADCYEKVGETCNKWLDILTTQGAGMTDSEVLELLVEQNNMSKPLDEYILAGQKSCAITCAGRMKEFLGSDIVRDKGLATTYVIAKRPEEAQVTERAIPVKIFEYPNEVARRKLLKKWTKDADTDNLNLRKLLDWDYYKGRLANAILKIVSIPAALQAVDNPVPRIEYPPWLVKKCRELKDKKKQRAVTSFFKALPKGTSAQLSGVNSLRDTANNTEKLSIEDIEDMPIRSWTAAKIADRRAMAIVTRKKREDRLSRQSSKKRVNREHVSFRSKATDPETRALESRQHMLELINRPHPSKRIDYPGWVRYAKRIWSAQRAARVRRYAAKRKRLESLESDKEEESESDEESKEKETVFGGESFAVKYGNRGNGSKRRRCDLGPSPDYAPKNFVADLGLFGASDGMNAFLAKKTVPLLGTGVVWQTVSISPVPDTPGEFELWVLPVRKEKGRLTTGQLYSIPLHMNRVLYCNSKVPTPPEIAGATCELVSGLSLPRSRESHHLFRVEMKEDTFQRTEKDLTSTLSDASVVEGVFGTQTPLEYEAVLTLGTLCAPKKSVAGRLTAREVLRRGLHIDDLVPRSADSAPYLLDSVSDNAEPTVSQAFIYGSHALDGSSRAMYAIVAPAAKTVHVIAVTPSGALNVNLKRLWRRVLQEKNSGDQGEGSEENGQGQLPADCVFSSNAFTTREEAWSELQQVLATLRNGSSVTQKSRSTGLKTILLAQWPTPDVSAASEGLFGPNAKGSIAERRMLGRLQDCLPAARSYPVVNLSTNAEDGNYMPVGWENRAASLALTRFADVSNWLSSHLHLSRFAGIPLGNMVSADVHSQALDVLVGRELLNRDHILWASKSPHPDLGGFEEDDCNLQQEIPSIPEICAPGSFRTVCVDTELSNLAIATILSSSHVNQLEGTDLAFDAATISGAKGSRKGVKDNHQFSKDGAFSMRRAAPLDEMASSASAFRILKDLVSTWDKAASNDSNPEVANIARGLLDHLLRWTRSESSMLYDPALARFLGWLIKKVFMQLVNELKTLGASVVYASLSRLILATPKTQTVDGLRYAGFLEKTLREKPLFRHVHFEPLLGVYYGLLFVDRFNYGALPAPEESAILSGEFEQSMSPTKRSQRTQAAPDIPYARMTWDIARYLPIPIAVLWTQVIEEFIRRPMVLRLRSLKEEEQNAEDDDSAELPGESEETTDSVQLALKKKKRNMRPRGDGFVIEVQEFTKNLTGQLLQKVHEIREKTPTLVFPNVPSLLRSHGDGRRNPALEFVRSICYVLSLDAAASEEVAAMRRTLLRLLGIREFAKEAQFVDPALPVPLHDVICTYCNAVVDLDIARDARLWTEQDDDGPTKSKGEKSQRSLWACEYCGNPYDMRQIELDLMKTAQKLYSSYQVQDLVCKRCNMVKRENMTEHCNCSGSAFELSVTRPAFYRKLRALRSVAEFHNFEFLLETVSWMTDSISDKSC